MSDVTPRDGDGRDNDRLLAELDEEITSWMERGGMDLVTGPNGRSVSDEAAAKNTIWGLAQQEDVDGTGTVGRSPGLLGRSNIDSDIRWSSLVAAYIDSLSGSLLSHTGEGGSMVSFGLDEGHAGGCG